jgi:hypothetical protein
VNLPITSRPSVGRDVHYVSHGSSGGEYPSTCRAAKIVEVGQWETTETRIDEFDPHQRTLVQRYLPEACALVVLNPTGMFFNADTKVCRHDETDRAAGTWHWPELL